MKCWIRSPPSTLHFEHPHVRLNTVGGSTVIMVMMIRLFTFAFVLGIFAQLAMPSRAASVELCREKKCPGTTKTCLQCKGSGPKGAPDCCNKIEQPPPKPPPTSAQ